MSQEGQDDQFPPPKLSARSAFGKQTFAGASGNDEDAPVPAIHGTAIEPIKAVRYGMSVMDGLLPNDS
jgi:hypothetical protein